MFELLTELADRYTETPDPQPEVTAYKFFSRLAGRAVRGSQSLATNDVA